MITATFTDPQGILHTGAVFHLRTANYVKTQREFYALNSHDFTTVNNPPISQVENINYSFYYWVNQTAKDNDAAPYILANSSEMDMDFNFTPDATYDGLTLEQKCEKHLIDVVLPPMQQA